MVNTPRHGLPLMSNASEQQWSIYSNAMKYIDARLNGFVKSKTNTPPGSPAEGDMYIVTSVATGAWVGQENKMAFYINAAWIFLAPTKGQIVYNDAVSTYHRWNGTQWIDTLATTTFGGVKIGKPASMELIAHLLFADTIIIPANCAGSVGRVITTAPAATYVMNLQKNGISVGSISISTLGVFTFSTSGGLPINLVSGDYLEVVGNAVADANLKDIALTFKGVK